MNADVPSSNMVSLEVAAEFSTLNAVVADVAPLPLTVVCPPCKKVVPFTFKVFVGVPVPIPTFPLELINNRVEPLVSNPKLLLSFVPKTAVAPNELPS